MTFYTRDYGHIDHGYAATVHKAQGMTVDRVHVLATPHMDRHAAYVALTRHRDGVALHYAGEDFAGRRRSPGRERAKDTSLDYDRPLASQAPGRDDAAIRRYAELRGLDRLHPVSEIVVTEPVRRKAVQQAAPALERQAAPAAEPLRDAGLQQMLAEGRAGFRERFEAHRRQQAQAWDEAAATALMAGWDRAFQAYKTALPKLETDPGAVRGAQEQLVAFGRGMRDQPVAVRVLREQGATFGVEQRPTLARVLADPQPEQAAAGIAAAAEAAMRVQLKELAEQEAARQRALEPKQRPSPGRGMSM